MFFVYVLTSNVKGLRFYVGMTSNIEQRLSEHNSGNTKSTKGYIPWQLFFYEEFQTGNDAREREKYLKGGSGKEKIKQKWKQKALAQLTSKQ